MSITERAEDMIYSMIEEYRKVNKDISTLKDDSNKLVEYLNDIRVTITPSYPLQACLRCQLRLQRFCLQGQAHCF